MPESLTFIVPLPPNLANGRMHWRTKERFRKNYFNTMDMLYAARLLPRPGDTWAQATVRAELFMKADMDDDNAMARCKWPVDWIVRKGYVLDDSRAHLRWEGLPAQTITRTKGATTALHLTLTKVASETSTLPAR